MKNIVNYNKSIQNKISLGNNIYVIGRNPEALSVSKKIDVKGIIDDFNNLQFGELKCFTSSQIGKDDYVINCSSSISPITTNHYLRKIGVQNLFSYYEIAKSFGLSPQNFVTETRFYYENYKQDFELFFTDFSDEKSKNIFEDVLNFRLTGNIKFMQNFKINIENQYLESIIDYSKKVFLDVGGFDGDTTELLLNKTDISHSHIFEPSFLNYDKAKKRLTNHNNVTFHNFGLSSKFQNLSFLDNNGSASKITNEGENEMEFKPLDAVEINEVGIIKIDVEGHEIDVLMGAIKTIKKFKPEIMVAIYHSGRDFIEIYKLIKSFNIYSKFYLRHYTEGWSETILICK